MSFTAAHLAEFLSGRGVEVSLEPGPPELGGATLTAYYEGRSLAAFFHGPGSPAVEGTLSIGLVRDGDGDPRRVVTLPDLVAALYLDEAVPAVV